VEETLRNERYISIYPTPDILEQTNDNLEMAKSLMKRVFPTSGAVSVGRVQSVAVVEDILVLRIEQQDPGKDITWDVKEQITATFDGSSENFARLLPALLQTISSALFDTKRTCIYLMTWQMMDTLLCKHRICIGVAVSL
jgi:predicted dinucleotide-utilizing enzyme